MTLIEWMALSASVASLLAAVVATVLYKAAVAELRKTTRDLGELHRLAENVRKKLAEYERMAAAFRPVLDRRGEHRPSSEQARGPSWP